MAEVALSERLAEGDLRVFPRKVRTMMTDLVNKHGVRWRMAKDGNHVFLYAGDKTIHPHKVSSQRSEESSVKSMVKWALTSVPSFAAEDQKELIQPAVSGGQEPTKLMEEAAHAVTERQGYLKGGTPSVLSKPEAAPFEVPLTERVADPAEREWVEIAGRLSEWLYWDRGVDPPLIRCMADDYTSLNKMGVHLHEAKHTGETVERAKKGAKVRKEKAAQRVLEHEQEGVLVHEAVRLLADHFGIGTEEKDAEIADLQRQITDLKQEVGDLKAKIQLIREASTM